MTIAQIGLFLVFSFIIVSSLILGFLLGSNFTLVYRYPKVKLKGDEIDLEDLRKEMELPHTSFNLYTSEETIE